MEGDEVSLTGGQKVADGGHSNRGYATVLGGAGGNGMGYGSLEEAVRVSHVLHASRCCALAFFLAGHGLLLKYKTPLQLYSTFFTAATQLLPAATVPPAATATYPM